MRDILFRGKRIDNGEWGEGIPIQTHIGVFMCFDENPHYCSQYGYMEIDKIAMVDEATVCQYTGLADKNGRKIFEGDILHFVNHINNNEWLCAVEFLEGSFICRYIYKDGELGEYNHFTSWHEKVKWEVAGNIFDNPELIGGAEK